MLQLFQLHFIESLSQIIITKWNLSKMHFKYNVLCNHICIFNNATQHNSRKYDYDKLIHSPIQINWRLTLETDSFVISKLITIGFNINYIKKINLNPPQKIVLYKKLTTHYVGLLTIVSQSLFNLFSLSLLC